MSEANTTTEEQPAAETPSETAADETQAEQPVTTEPSSETPAETSNGNAGVSLEYIQAQLNEFKEALLEMRAAQSQAKPSEEEAPKVDSKEDEGEPKKEPASGKTGGGAWNYDFTNRKDKKESKIW